MADDFLGTYAPLANDIATRTGVDPSVVLGIIDTETGGGKHVLGNNIFGISPSGPQGQYVARYPDVQTAANAFITLMQTPPYRGVAAATDPAAQAAALVKGGYNTVNPKYASIVTGKALNFGKQLGYQDGSGGAPSGPAVYSTSSQPAASADQPTALSYSDSPTPAAAPAQQPVQPPAPTGSAKDRALSDPALGGNATSAPPASGGSAKDRVLADPALAAPAQKSTTPTQPGPGVPSPDEQSAETGLPLPSSPSPALNRITGAAAEGWSGVPAIPRVPTDLVMAPVYNPLLAGVETALRAGGAVLRGGQQAAVEMLPNQLGRDVAALPEAFPFGFNALHPPGRPPVPEAPPPGPRFVSDLTAPPRPPGMTDAARINQLVEHAVNEEQPAMGPPLARGPATQEIVPPAPVVAPPVAVPPQPIPNNLTPAQVAEFRNIPEALPPAAKPIETQADAAARADQIINHFASIGNKEPIPGAEGALPTITGNSGLATLYRAVRDSDTPVPFTTLENASKAKAMSTLEDMGATTSQASQDRLAAAIENRAQTTAPMYKQAFDNKTSADTTGSTQMVEDLLESKAKQNDNLRPELEAIQKKLAGETDPEQLKGIVDNIDTTMDRLGTEGKGDRETRRVMSAVKDQLISEIGPAAPGFDAAQATYSRLSRDVDRMKYFQGRKLTDLQGNPTLGNMRSMLDDIRKKQAGDKFHPADSVTPEDVETIQGIHDQMQREQFTATAGKALGSNTFQNLATNAQVGRLGGHMSNALLASGAAAVDMLHGGSGLGGAIIGNVLAEGGKYVRGRRATTAEATAERGRAMLMQELRDRLLNIDNKGVDALRGAPPP